MRPEYFIGEECHSCPMANAEVHRVTTGISEFTRSCKLCNVALISAAPCGHLFCSNCIVRGFGGQCAECQGADSPALRCWKGPAGVWHINHANYQYSFEPLKEQTANQVDIDMADSALPYDPGYDSSDDRKRRRSFGSDQIWDHDSMDEDNVGKKLRLA